jgi:hypothetical protein
MKNIKLCYRGVAYTLTSPKLEQISGKIAGQYRVGQYRGAVWQFPCLKLILPVHPTVVLKYRGGFYVAHSPVAMDLALDLWGRTDRSIRSAALPY